MKAVRFIADDQALFVTGLGLVLGATSVLEPLHAKVMHPPNGSQAPSHLSCLFFCLFCVSFQQRFVIIANDDTIETVLVEENADELTQTEASKVLRLL